MIIYCINLSELNYQLMENIAHLRKLLINGSWVQLETLSHIGNEKRIDSLLTTFDQCKYVFISASPQNHLRTIAIKKALQLSKEFEQVEWISENLYSKELSSLRGAVVRKASLLAWNMRHCMWVHMQSRREYDYRLYILKKALKITALSAGDLNWIYKNSLDVNAKLEKQILKRLGVFLLTFSACQNMYRNKDYVPAFKKEAMAMAVVNATRFEEYAWVYENGDFDTKPTYQQMFKLFSGVKIRRSWLFSNAPNQEHRTTLLKKAFAEAKDSNDLFWVLQRVRPEKDEVLRIETNEKLKKFLWR